MEITCANCGYKGPASEFEEKAREVEVARRKKAEEVGEAVEQAGHATAVCPKCDHDEFLG